MPIPADFAPSIFLTLIKNPYTTSPEVTLAPFSYGAFQPPGAHGACLGMFPTLLGVFLALWVRPDPSYSLYFQPRNTYFLAQCQGLFGGMVAVVKALLSARMLCHVASMA